MYAFLCYVFNTLNGGQDYGFVFLGSAPQPHDGNVISANVDNARNSTGEPWNLQPGFVSCDYQEFPFRIL